MLFSVLDLRKARRSRRAAVAAIAPFVRESRRQANIPDGFWLDPYVVGFMVMLITLVARREERTLDTHVLGLIQSEAWSEITGLEVDLIGEEVLHLSSAGDRMFELGCRNALVFEQELGSALARGGSAFGSCEGLEPGCAPGLSDERPHALGTIRALALWSRCFDQYLTELPMGPRSQP
jgi:hypothetical protein